MKIIIVLSALATVAIAVPVWDDGNKQEPQHNTIHKTIRRERKSTIQESPADLSLDQETGISKNHANHKSSFRKPVIVKKKFGYQIFRDSDEELAQAQPRENCRRQFRFKLCDESDETAVNNMRNTNTEDMEERDVQHSLKMAKEAVEILQRDLKKIEESTKTMHKNHLEENVEGKLQTNIEQAKEASQLLNQNIENLHAASLKATSSNEINLEKTDSKVEESRMAKWKEAIENIQKNVEIVKNIEDKFKSAELSHVSAEENMETKSKHTEKLDGINAFENDEKSRSKADENMEVKSVENVHENIAAKSDMESYATETKQTHAGLHSDSLKLDNARNWDKTENVRQAETDAWQENTQEFNNETPQLRTIAEKEEKAVLHDADDLQVKDVIKKTDVIDEIEKIQHSKVQHEKSVTNENNEELLEKSNNLNAEVKSHKIIEDKVMSKSAEDKNTIRKTGEAAVAITEDKHFNENVAEGSESKNLIHTENNMITAKQALNQEWLGKSNIDSEMRSNFDSNLRSLNADLPVRPADNLNEGVTSLKNAGSTGDSHLQMREALEQTSDDKIMLEKSNMENREHEINGLRKTEELKEMEGSRAALKIDDKNDKMHNTNFEKTGMSEASQMLGHVDTKTEDKQLNHKSAGFQKSVDLKNTDENPNNFAKDEPSSFLKHNEKMLDQGNGMRFVDEYGDLNRNLALNTPDIGYQQRMSEMDFFNNMDSQHGAQLVADKNMDFHTSSHINEGMSEWERRQQHLHSMLRPPFMPWMQDRLRSNVNSQLGNQHDNMGNMQLGEHEHDHHFNKLQTDGHHRHHHHAVPMGRFVNNIQTGINHELLNPMMRENAMESGGAVDSSMQPSMQINMRDAFDQNEMRWNYQPTGKSGFGTGTIGVFPNSNTGCGIPLMLSCSPSVVSGSLAKQSSLAYPGHAFRSGDDIRFHSRRDAQGINEKTANNKSFPTSR